MPYVLLVMRKPGNIRILSKALEHHAHTCKGANSRETLALILGEERKPDVALVDVTGFGEPVWSMCEKLQAQDVPFVVLSAKQELRLSSKSLSYGATSILEKPVVKSSLLKLINEIGQARAQ